jgi:hypothetical protein
MARAVFLGPGKLMGHHNVASGSCAPSTLLLLKFQFLTAKCVLVDFFLVFVVF